MTNMVERVARALCIEVGNISYDDLPESATYLERKTHVDRPILDRQEAREVAKEVTEAITGAFDAGRFEEWPTKDLAAQCRMQGRHGLDPEYQMFMDAVANRLTALREPNEEAKRSGE